jgi:hypothetical protein
MQRQCMLAYQHVTPDAAALLLRNASLCKGPGGFNMKGRTVTSSKKHANSSMPAVCTPTPP